MLELALRVLVVFGVGIAAASARPVGDIWDDSPALRTPLTVAPRAEPNVDGAYVVDLLVLHTPLYAERVGGSDAVTAEIQRFVDITNTAFANSRVPVEVHLVGQGLYAATGEADGVVANRNELPDNPDVARLRDELAADLVLLLRTEDGVVEACGLGSAFNDRDQTDPPDNVDPERDAFSVVVAAPDADGQLSCDTHTFAHEIGHSLGAGHSYALDAAIGARGDYWKPYSHGSVCGGTGEDSTYVSVVFGIGLDLIGVSEGERLGPAVGEFFSNPDLVLEGQACGSTGVAGLEATQANNAGAMREAAPYVAAYRLRRVDGSSRSAATGAGAIDLSMLLMVSLAALIGFGSRGASECLVGMVR